jgi:hypothetical protein
MKEDTKATPKPKPRMQYVGPEYSSGIVLPGFPTPVNPKVWDETLIRTFVRKYPASSRYFAEK